VTRYSYQGGKSFEGYAPSGMERKHPHRLRAAREPDPLKHGEPHGRLQGAIDLQGAERRKPSESGGTARTEQAWRLAPPGQREGFGRPGSGRTAFVSAEGRSLNPKRGVQTGPPRPSGPGGEERTARTGTLSSEERLGHEIDSWSSRPTNRPESAPTASAKGRSLRERPNDPQDDRLPAAKEGLRPRRNR